LIPKYHFLGHSNLIFYKILSKNDTMMLRQSSRIFQSYSPLYIQKNKEAVDSENLAEKMFKDENKNLIKCIIFEDIENIFSEDIVFNGHVIGKLEGLIQIKKIPLIKQIMC